MITNYHADYVLPYWAADLDKEVQIGRHIFYRLKGNLGLSSAFRQRYSGREPAVIRQATTIVTGQTIEASSQILAPDLPGSVTVDRTPNPIIAADAVAHEQLSADSRTSALILDDGAPATVKKPVTRTAACPGRGITQILPAAPNELRSDAKHPC